MRKLILVIILLLTSSGCSTFGKSRLLSKGCFPELPKMKSFNLSSENSVADHKFVIDHRVGEVKVVQKEYIDAKKCVENFE